MQLEDMGSYTCTASTNQDSSSSIGVLVIRDHYRFEVTITPSYKNIDIGGTAKYACKISPPPPLGGNVQVIYTWSRSDNRPISSNAVGMNTNTLTLVNSTIYFLIVFVYTLI